MAIKLDDLSTEEKLGIMEHLWADFCCNASESLSPAWHGDLLACREKSLVEGDASFTDWEEAKKNIRESV